MAARLGVTAGVATAEDGMAGGGVTTGAVWEGGCSGAEGVCPM